MNEIKVLITGASNFGKGGVSNIAWNLCTNINNDRINVDFFSDKVSDPEYSEKAKKLGINFYLTGKKNNKLINWINKYIKLNKILKENNYSCVHINASVSFSALVYSIVVKKHKARIIIHSHSTDVDSVKFKKTRRILHYLFKSFIDFKHASLIACSDAAAGWMFPEQNARYRVLKNGINPDIFVFNSITRERIRCKLSVEDKFVIGHIGRFAYPKNQSFLIDIFYQVYIKNKNTVLLLIGEGPMEQQLKDKVNKLGLSDNVIFYGTTDKVYELYQAMDCFVFPSHFEGLGIVAIEAQAAGLQTLCSDTIPAEAKITDLFDYMSLKDSAESWADKILGYNNGYKRKDMSEEIKAAGYDIKQSAKQLEEIYLECSDK